MTVSYARGLAVVRAPLAAIFMVNILRNNIYLYSISIEIIIKHKY